MSNGKGDKRRPEDNQKFREGHERIFGSKHRVVKDFTTKEVVYEEGQEESNGNT